MRTYKFSALWFSTILSKIPNWSPEDKILEIDILSQNRLNTIKNNDEQKNLIFVGLMLKNPIGY